MRELLLLPQVDSLFLSGLLVGEDKLRGDPWYNKNSRAETQDGADITVIEVSSCKNNKL